MKRWGISITASYLIVVVVLIAPDSLDAMRARMVVGGMDSAVAGGGGTLAGAETPLEEVGDTIGRYKHETPDKHYEKQWAINLLGRVTQALRDDFSRRGMEQRYDVLKDALQWNGQSAPYAELGQKIGLDANAVKQAVLRMRRRYRCLLTEEIQSTLGTDDPQIVQDELAYLAAAFQS